MENHAGDMVAIATVAAVAATMGIAFLRLGQPPIIGYVLSGLVLGPAGFGLVQNTEVVTFLAELGVIMLLFLIGMEISIRMFLPIIRPASLVALLQIAAGLAISGAFATFFDWSLGQSLLLGFIFALSSTAVAMAMLGDIDELRRETGRITIGVLIAQDIAVVPMLIIVNSFDMNSADGTFSIVEIASRVIVALGGLAFLFWLLSRPGKIRLPFADAIGERVDLTAIACLALCFASAALSTLIDLSPAYGAFVAGLLIAGSTLRTKAIEVTEPIQSVLLIVFFLSIGLLIDFDFLKEHALAVLVLVFAVVAVKSTVNVLFLRLVDRPWEQAFPGGLCMAQIGEFSFVLAAAGLSASLLDTQGYKLAVATIAISLLISPLWMSLMRTFHDIATNGVTDFRKALAETFETEVEQLDRGRRLLRWRLRSVRRLTRSLSKAANAFLQRRSRKGAKEPEQPAPAILAPLATADAYPVEESDLVPASQKRTET